MRSAVTIDAVGHAFPGTAPLFMGVTATLHPGDLVALTGPSGSGKTTFLALLAGFIRPTYGTVTWESVPRIHWTHQSPRGVPRRTALDHVVLPLLAAGASRASAEPDALEIMGRFDVAQLGHAQYRHLSGGEAQRVQLARAVAANPDLLLIDEPTAQLDPENARSVISVIDRLLSNDGIVVIATHDERVTHRATREIRLGQP